MATKDWLVPLVVFGVSFGTLLAADPSKERVGTAVCDDPYEGLTFAFAPDRGTLRQAPGPLIVVSDAVRPGGWEHVEAPDCAPTSGVADIHWVAPHLGLQNGSLAGCQSGDCIHEPQLLHAGFNATKVTVHVFDGEGELIASNGDPTELPRLVRASTPEELPKGVWYLGANATAPPGTQKPPAMAAAFLAQARPMLMGLQDENVVSTQTDALAFLYGRLYITLRVDDVVYAP